MLPITSHWNIFHIYNSTSNQIFVFKSKNKTKNLHNWCICQIAVRHQPQNTTQWKETNHSLDSNSKLIQSAHLDSCIWGPLTVCTAQECQSCPPRTDSNSSGAGAGVVGKLLFTTPELRVALPTESSAAPRAFLGTAAHFCPASAWPG